MTWIASSDFTAYGKHLNTDSDDDELITAFCTRATNFIEEYTGRTFSGSSDNEADRFFDASSDVDGYTLWLDEDICTIVLVTNGDGTTVTSDQYVTEPRNETPYYALKLRALSNVSWTYDSDRENAITVNGIWAYSTDAPDALKHAAVRLVDYWWQQRQGGADLDRPIRTSEGLTIMPMQIPKDVETILDMYKKVVLA